MLLISHQEGQSLETSQCEFEMDGTGSFVLTERTFDDVQNCPLPEAFRQDR